MILRYGLISKYLYVENRYEFERITDHSKNNTIPTNVYYIDNLTIWELSSRLRIHDNGLLLSPFSIHVVHRLNGYKILHI